MPWLVILENELGTQFMRIQISDFEPSYNSTTGEKITEKSKVLEAADIQNQKFAKSYDRDPYVLKEIYKVGGEDDPVGKKIVRKKK